MTDLLYTEVEEDLRASVRALLADHSPLSQVLKRAETLDTYDLHLWRSLTVDLGVAGLIVPERLGGAGATYREAAVVLEELGRAVAPVPYLGSAVVATTALLACGTPAADELVTALARGDRTAALVAPFSALVTAPTVTADGDRLSGTVTTVADALPADVLLVPTGAGLYAVPARDVVVVPVVSLDLTRQLCDVTLDGAVGTLVAPAAVAGDAVARAVQAGAAMLASEQLGVATWCLETTVEYLKTRYQFGRKIGSYQALKHRIADVWVDVTQARAVARYAADCLATGDPDLPVATALAQAFVGPVAVRTAEECLQLHGGVGFTWEYPIHLFLKRATADSLAFGTAGAHRAALAALIDLAPPEA
jgi:alkylation response protein AidB-like acyl-CoA dehydrogenase